MVGSIFQHDMILPREFLQDLYNWTPKRIKLAFLWDQNEIISA